MKAWDFLSDNEKKAIESQIALAKYRLKWDEKEQGLRYTAQESKVRT
jgi:hypothetical protein